MFEARMFVIEGITPAEQDRYIAGLIRSGEAKPTDSFIHTGVPRSRPSHTNHGPIPELMGRIATHGRKLHGQRIEQRLRKLELGTTVPRRLRIVFSATSDEADWDSQIAAMIRKGQASPEDEFMRIGWMP
jgi:hypothetical protein